MNNLLWFSAGVTSAVACKIALNKYSNNRIIYIETGSHHKDNLRFLKDCEKWYNQEIEIHKNTKYKNHFEVIKKAKFINSPKGAKCTKVLKKDVRLKIEKEGFQNQIFGFEFTPKEINRAIRFKQQYQYTNPIFPLIDAKLNKNNCAYIIKSNNIELPIMYQLGYNNNNCLGCVKGGAGYWNKIKKDFPDIFFSMAELEQQINATCLKENGKKIFLKDLPDNKGNNNEIIMPSCDIFCSIDFENLIDKNVEKIIKNQISINDIE